MDSQSLFQSLFIGNFTHESKCPDIPKCRVSRIAKPSGNLSSICNDEAYMSRFLLDGIISLADVYHSPSSLKGKLAKIIETLALEKYCSLFYFIDRPEDMTKYSA